MTEKFKTVHENEVFINPPMTQQTVVEKYNKLAEKVNKITELQRWNDTYDGMCLDIDGEFILLEDVLKLLGE